MRAYHCTSSDGRGAGGGETAGLWAANVLCQCRCVCKDNCVVTLDETDGVWAWNLGLTFGAWYPKLEVDLLAFGMAFREYSDPMLNDVAAQHGRRTYGLATGTALSDIQITAELPYLQELSQTAAYAAEAALYYRRDATAKSWRGRDPRIEAPDQRALQKYAQAVSGYLESHPDLRFHLRVDVVPVYADGSNLPPAPAAQPYGVSHAGAEQFVAAWMQHLGAIDARPTQISGDGGIDVVSARYIAQVKNLAAAAAVPVAAIRDLAGVAFVDGRRAAMFTSGTFSAGGLDFANSAGIALFRYDALRGTLVAANNVGRGVLIEGMG